MNLKNLIFYTFFIIFSCTLNPIKSATQTIALKKVSSTIDDSFAPFVEKINAFITQKANNIGLDRESMNKATTELETKLAQLHNLITYGAPYTKQENEATASSYTKNIGLGTGIATAGLISGAMAYDITKKLEDPDKVNYYPGKRTTRGRYRKPFTKTNKQEAISEILLTPFVAGFGGAVMGGLAALISANVLSQIMKEQNYTQDKINILLNEVKIKIKEYQEQANSGAIDPERKKLKTSFLTTIKEKFSNKDITKLSP